MTARLFHDRPLDDVAKAHWPEKMSLVDFFLAMMQDWPNFKANMEHLGLTGEKWPEQWMETFLAWAEFNTIEPMVVSFDPDMPCSGVVPEEAPQPPPPPGPPTEVVTAADELIGYRDTDGTFTYADTPAARTHKWVEQHLKAFICKMVRKPYKSYTDEP